MQAVLILTGLMALLYILARKEVICKECHFIGKIRKKNPENAFVTILLLCLGIIPGLIYILVCQSKKAFVCPVCSSRAVIPTKSPLGRQMIGIYRQEK